jgi:hypothetical protein
MVKPSGLAPAFRFLSQIDATVSSGNQVNAYQLALTLAAVESARGLEEKV